MKELVANISINAEENKDRDMIEVSIELDELALSLEGFNGAIWTTSSYDEIMILDIDNEEVLNKFKSFFNEKGITYNEY